MERREGLVLLLKMTLTPKISEAFPLKCNASDSRLSLSEKHVIRNQMQCDK